MVTGSVIETAQQFVESLPAALDVKRAFVFGSYVKGTQKETSDIDIAIIVGKMTDFFEVQMELFRRRRKIDLRIEPHPIDEKDFSEMNPFAAEILESGIEIMNAY